ncbi:hypothetical protein EV421DRAFT_789545 [Armillaria borealis]|uniref:Uncharacterized protein n=1 Tax=Armillaria borealis TaxID=47425 RepID=A0AA39JCI2_9AGAR|nr:hypothetical protein EV421DRAFT_789545 [Armillaria borealis]
MPEQDTCNDEIFPLKYVRLQRAPYLIVVYLARLASRGWCVEKFVFLAGPSGLQVGLEFIIVDLLPANVHMVNLMSIACCYSGLYRRQLYSKIGCGWTDTSLGGICVLLLPSVLLKMYIAQVQETQKGERHYCGVNTYLKFLWRSDLNPDPGSIISVSTSVDHLLLYPTALRDLHRINYTRQHGG